MSAPHGCLLDAQSEGPVPRCNTTIEQTLNQGHLRQASAPRKTKIPRPAIRYGESYKQTWGGFFGILYADSFILFFFFS
ncbi:hypothetical protein PpBr36_04994 [Pyricularia pennisetigena]|uniref:hypothetical protein n=1 Tax=Pyricularia pennisetigena TaxID=1578925 RepID=UPI0011514329|nr:hypothetical protein PpBr36_04994 [Pyricularia pennisetigena]TLS26601.1 hypothetical protein PpBr36_04994 [Pyricularia pennisetigena]